MGQSRMGAFRLPLRELQGARGKVHQYMTPGWQCMSCATPRTNNLLATSLIVLGLAVLARAVAVSQHAYGRVVAAACLRQRSGACNCRRGCVSGLEIYDEIELVGCSTGKSAGFAPFRIGPTASVPAKIYADLVALGLHLPPALLVRAGDVIE